MSEKCYALYIVGREDPISSFTATDLETAISEKYDSLNATSRDGNFITTPLLHYEIREETFPTKLRLYRFLRDMDIYTLSVKTGISKYMLEHYEAKHLDINKARAITVHKLSQALECEIEDLLETT